MTVQNMTGTNGNKIPNQFILTDRKGNETFQSYDSIIVKKKGKKVILDLNFWDYSRTTTKYRNRFLRETTKETQRKIDSGEYSLKNLNK